MKEVLDIIDGVNIIEFNTPVLVIEIYVELDIMIWIFVICGDWNECTNRNIGNNEDFYVDESL